ncbi:DUF4917 family protein [Rhodobacteraceae bacterium R_SAG5]|nr:DUF4917 family protein [Rhodobacteraceae bacterium R_SAG5]
MALQVMSFEDALRLSDKYGKRHLLLGNGFSIACKPNIFSYSSLFVEAEKKMPPELAEIFSTLGTQDFERVIRALIDASKILGIYLPKDILAAERLVKDSERLKSDLIQAVAGTHPARPFDVTDEQYSACRLFLANFISAGSGGKVYTLNYDLLLYWTLMHEVDELNYDYVDLDHDDGFRKDLSNFDAEYVEWQGEGASNTGQNVHYLHGALHLFDAGYQLQKYTWKNSGKALVDQANEALKRNTFPVFVAEGSSASKLSKIMHNAYLHHNLKSFASICQVKARSGKALFVYGHSFDSNDTHILNRIGYGKIDHLFVSLYGDPDSRDNTQIRANVSAIADLRGETGPRLDVTYYDAASAAVWG